MALNTTTLSSAVGQLDTSIVVASATGALPGTFILVDQETMKIAQSYVSGTTLPVLRGQDGSVQTSHKVTANAVLFLASDETPAAGNYVQFPKVRGRDLLSYSATGAITLPTPGNDMIALLNGTSVLAMTLANPTKDMDGCMLYIIANGKAAHTVTYTAGVGNGGGTMDVGTYNGTEQTGCAMMAANGFWVLWANGIGSTGTQLAGVVWA